MHASSILGYAFAADIHCPDCTHKAWQNGSLARDAAHCYAHKERDENGLPMDLVDHEGNIIHPLFLDAVEQTEHCGDCGEVIYTMEE